MQFAPFFTHLLATALRQLWYALLAVVCTTVSVENQRWRHYTIPVALVTSALAGPPLDVFASKGNELHPVCLAAIGSADALLETSFDFWFYRLKIN